MSLMGINLGWLILNHPYELIANEILESAKEFHSITVKVRTSSFGHLQKKTCCDSYLERSWSSCCAMEGVNRLYMHFKIASLSIVVYGVTTSWMCNVMWALNLSLGSRFLFIFCNFECSSIYKKPPKECKPKIGMSHANIVFGSK